VEITLLLKSIVGLIIFLAILLYFLIMPSKKQQKRATKRSNTVGEEENFKTDKASLIAVIKNKSSSAQELSKALKLILKYHGRIHKKLGELPHPEFDYYMDVLFTLCRHPNANKDIIISFDRELQTRNEQYIKDINDAIAKGLNSRGV